ncbi:Cubilin, partial [Stegodyphus mimosarum]
MESKGRKMKITFRSNSQINADGFNIKYSSGCGGNFTQYHGQIFSPNYPVTYGDNLNCTYTIGKPGQYISITFDENFSIEQNTDCTFDYLEIYQMQVSEGTKQGKYCGSIQPATRTLLGPVTVRFITDVSYGSRGFLLNYEIMSCGAIFTEPRGVISTPPSLNTVSYMDCTWQITAQPNKVIALKFSSFELEPTYNCWLEYLEIRDGNLTGPLIGRLCTSDKVTYKSSGNQMSLRYHSEYKKTEKGFSAFYYSTYGPSQGCGGMLNTSTGEIKSVDVDSDGQYESNLDCNWLIMSSSPNQVILLNFTSFNVESSRNNTCVYDYVELRDGMSKDSPLIGHYCGSTPPSSLITSGNRVTVIFHTNDAINLAGFTIKYSLIPSPCGSTALTSLSSAQNLTSPHYPSPYPINLRCSWVISKNTSTAYSYYEGLVQISINEIDIPCNGDYVEIQKKYQYDDVKALRLCGSKHPHEIVSQSGVTVTFHSGGVNNGARGFSFSYKNADCNRTFMKDNGILTNPDYPSQYNTESYCAMTINATAGKTISLYFQHLMIHVSGNCAEEYLKIYDGQNTSARLLSILCGFETAPPIFSTGNFLHLVFSIKYSFGSFYATYTTTDQGRGCGGRLYAEKGALSSPLFPQPYNRTAECIWYISVPGYHTARVQFTSFALNSTDGCDTNYVEIYDGHTVDIGKRIVRYCGTDTPAQHNSENNEIIVRFVSSPSNDRPGFTMTFESNGYFPENAMSVIQLHPVEAEDSYSNDYMYL